MDYAEVSDGYNPLLLGTTISTAPRPQMPTTPQLASQHDPSKPLAWGSK